MTVVELRERIESSHRELTAVADATGLGATVPDGWNLLPASRCAAKP